MSIMSIKGVKQLQKLLVSYSMGGSSRGVREFMDTGLIAFAQQNPQIAIQARPVGFRVAPTIQATWINGYEETQPLANLGAKEVAGQLGALRSRVGRDQATRTLVGVPLSAHKSVQGNWSPTLFMKNDLERPGLLANGQLTVEAAADEKGLWLISDGMPHPVTKESWEQMAESRTKQLDEHLAKKAVEKKAAAKK